MRQPRLEQREELWPVHPQRRCLLALPLELLPQATGGALAVPFLPPETETAAAAAATPVAALDLTPLNRFLRVGGSYSQVRLDGLEYRVLSAPFDCYDVSWTGQDTGGVLRRRRALRVRATRAGRCTSPRREYSHSSPLARFSS